MVEVDVWPVLALPEAAHDGLGVSARLADRFNAVYYGTPRAFPFCPSAGCLVSEVILRGCGSRGSEVFGVDGFDDWEVQGWRVRICDGAGEVEGEGAVASA